MDGNGVLFLERVRNIATELLSQSWVRQLLRPRWARDIGSILDFGLAFIAIVTFWGS